MSEDDEVLVVLSSGKVVRSAVAEVPAKGRDTMGVVFARTTEADRILAIARNGERGLTEEETEPDADAEAPRRLRHRGYRRMSTVADKLAKKSTRKTGGKQVRLRLVYVDFWSAVKLSFLGAVALAVVTMVSFFLIFLVLQATGIMSTADEFVRSFTDGAIPLSELVGLPQVMAFAAVVAILNLIVFTVLGAVVAGIYNLAVKVTGGLLVGFMSN